LGCRARGARSARSTTTPSKRAAAGTGMAVVWRAWALTCSAATRWLFQLWCAGCREGATRLTGTERDRHAHVAVTRPPSAPQYRFQCSIVWPEVWMNTSLEALMNHRTAHPPRSHYPKKTRIRRSEVESSRCVSQRVSSDRLTKSVEGVSDSVPPTDRPAARSAAKQILDRNARPTDPPV